MRAIVDELWAAWLASPCRLPACDTAECHSALRAGAIPFLVANLVFGACSASAQNIIEDGSAGKTVPPIEVTLSQVEDILRYTPLFSAALSDQEANRIRAKLEKHVDEMIAGAPWKPFHHTLGISGYEAYFDHPDETFHSLSIAVPTLTPETAAKVRRFLASELESYPPYATAGYDRDRGRERESYIVPERLRLSGVRQDRDHFGVYAFWEYSHYAGATNAARAHWPAVLKRLEPLLSSEYRFDIRKRDYSRDEAEVLNGDIAGLIGCVRLARLNADDATAQRALKKLTELLGLRINLERVNPRILEKTTASKSLHISKLARYCDLTPELGEALRTLTDGCAAAHLRAFREPRNTWHLAFGDRMIGGENYTNPLHFPRAIFAGAAFVENLSGGEMLTFVDVPWCKGDLYFIEKAVHALWSSSNRPVK